MTGYLLSIRIVESDGKLAHLGVDVDATAAEAEELRKALGFALSDPPCFVVETSWVRLSMRRKKEER